MGVADLWTVLSPAAKRDTLSHYTVRNGIGAPDGPRSLTIGCDAAIWLEAAQKPFTYNHASAGPVPELRTLFYRLANISQHATDIIFVFDGFDRPAVKRGVNVVSHEHWMIPSFKELAIAFGFKVLQAPGEAEAELARLNQAGVIHAVLTEDVDALIFGARTVLRAIDLHEGIIDVYESEDIEAHPSVKLTAVNMTLIALLRGGDYSPGLDGCGIKIAVGLARYGFGYELLKISYLSGHQRTVALSTWRSRLVKTLRTDPEGLIGRRYPKLAGSIPITFPDMDIYRLYRTPTVRMGPDRNLPLDLALIPRLPDIPLLLELCRRLFWWKAYKTLGCKFIGRVLPALVIRTAIAAADTRPIHRVMSSPITAICSFKAAKAPNQSAMYRVEYEGAPYLDILRRFIDDPQCIPKTTNFRLWIPSTLACFACHDLVQTYTAGLGGIAPSTTRSARTRRKRICKPAVGPSSGRLRLRDLDEIFSEDFETSDEDERASDERLSRAYAKIGGGLSAIKKRPRHDSESSDEVQILEGPSAPVHSSRFGHINAGGPSSACAAEVIEISSSSDGEFVDVQVAKRAHNEQLNVAVPDLPSGTSRFASSVCTNAKESASVDLDSD